MQENIAANEAGKHQENTKMQENIPAKEAGKHQENTNTRKKSVG